MATRTQILKLYKEMLRESQKFSNYNYRCYAFRRIQDAFKDSKGLTDQKIIRKEMEYAIENLAVIRRQIVIGSIYSSEKLVIENQR
ncbi:hypothetical protein JYU34_000889 [Plutella xylostella]|uniref:Uncharacterized protein n=2 Tax=Plutella xylostella TaxID=51655 RepID=A0ABQ7R5N3_PLUXY|nr:LYR motif-containing protein 4 [Plutella xylostella]KAG7312585.1 hypothetical protein JYU34_000889 [Plutella xylostella]CAG9134181.1 unnamed protein product [Plutella xylostella]